MIEIKNDAGEKAWGIEGAELDWQIYKWQPGGEIIKTGKHKGEKSKPKWVPMGMYMSSEFYALRKIASMGGREMSQTNHTLESYAERFENWYQNLYEIHVRDIDED